MRVLRLSKGKFVTLLESTAKSAFAPNSNAPKVPTTFAEFFKNFLLCSFFTFAPFKNKFKYFLKLNKILNLTKLKSENIT